MFLQRLQTVLYFSLCVSLSWCREGESNVQNQLDNLNAIKNAVDPANGGPQNVGGPANLVQGPPVDDSDIINLAEHPLCAQDVRRLCHDIPLRREGDATKQAKNSLDVLECFLNHDDKAVSADCHQVMWDFKKNVTKDKRIAGIADAQCATDLMGDLSVCSKYHADPGHFISCLVEEKQKVKNEACLAFINKVAVVVFSDYRLVSFFTEACDDDIKRLRCGFLDNRGQAGHSQGAAISCLVHTLQQEQQLKLSANQDPAAKKKLDEIGQISEKCGHEVMRLMELQADDFHLDRTLFFACRDDRETFCHDIQSGQGRVYQCLMKNIANERMSTECKEQLRQREVAAQTDYKVDYGVAHSCQNEIQTHSCIPPSTYKQEFGLSYVILCLEGAIHKQAQNVQKAFSPQCMQALYQQRQAMMSDYNLTPQIVVFCKTDIEEHCSRGVHPTAIVHCLMGVAKEQVKVGEGKDVTYQSKLGPVCGREIQQLMLVADPAADVKVDVVLYKACGNIIEARCGGTAHSPAIQIMGCLMENMHAEEMTAECEKHLLETHYFVTRDIRLDAQLFAACKDEAVNRCNLKDNWSPEKKDMAPESGPMTFACLYRHALGLGPDKTGLSEQCLAQVKATLHQRAIAMDIPPEVDVNCIHDLAYFCSDRQYRKGQEMNCLQSNYAKLQDVCKTAVQHYSQAQDKDVKLSTTYQNCAPMLAKYCPGLTPQSTFDDAMDCLIPHKEEAEMSKPCAAEIEHYQMKALTKTSLKYSP